MARTGTLAGFRSVPRPRGLYDLPMRTATSCVGILAIVLTAVTSAAQTTAFADESLAWGVLFQHKDTANTQTMGGGVAFFDYDGDGDEDLFVTSSDGLHRLFEHTGKKFVDRTAGSGLTPRKFPDTMGVIVGDYNQDGRPDLYVTNFGPNQLFTNLGGGKFREDSAAMKVRGNSWSVSASWADFDRDGDLDLYVGDYVSTMNFPYHIGTPNKLYVNVGTATKPQFVERAKQLGVDDTGAFRKAVQNFPYPKRFLNIIPGAQAWGCTLSVHTLDFDNDGDQDLMVGNDFGEFVLPNRLYRNDTPRGGPLKFTDVSTVTGFSNNGHYNMGIVSSDYDLDGDWDFYNANLGPNIFHQNRNGYFVDVAAAAGPTEGWNSSKTLILSSWGMAFWDFDNDLWEDLLVVNGFIRGAASNRNDPNSENHLWLNKHDGTFKRVVPATSGMADVGAGRGLALSDVNSDGQMDFYVMNNGGIAVTKANDRCRLFVNKGQLGKGNHWLQIRLLGWLSNREALGARLMAEVGGRVLRRQVLGDPVYLSSGTRVVQFGLGSSKEIPRLVIDWPSGIHQEIVGLPGDQRFHIREPRVTMDAARAPSWSGRSAQWSVDLSNLTGRTVTVQVAWLLHVGKGGPLALTIGNSVKLNGLEKKSVSASIPMPLAAWMKLKGMTIDQHAYVVCDGAVDSRRRVDFLK